MRTFADLTTDEVANILNIAMDNGDWHTPSASDIKILEQSKVVVYGYFNCSKHNTFHDQERYFNINGDTVQIWVREYVRGKADKCNFKPIYNIIQLAGILKGLKEAVK